MSAPPSQQADQRQGVPAGTPRTAALHLHSGRSPLWRLLDLAQHCRREIATGLVYASVIGILTLATPLAVQVLVNNIAFGMLTQPVVALAILLAAALALSAFFQALEAVVVEWLSRRVFSEVALGFADRLAKSPPESPVRARLPALANHFYDVVTLEKALSRLIYDGSAATLQIIVGLVLLAVYHPLLLAFGAAILLATLFLLTVMSRGAGVTAFWESFNKHGMAAHLVDIALRPMLFGSSTGRRFALAKASRHVHAWLDAREQHFRLVFRQRIGFWLLQIVANTSLLFVGGLLVIRGQLTLGQLVAAELIMTVTTTSLSKLAKLMPYVYDLAAAVEKIAIVLELPEEPERPLPPPKAPFEITLQGVSMLDAGGAPLLGPLDWRITPGQHQFVKMPRRQGHALVRVLLGRTEPNGGQVVVDGHPLRHIDPAAWRDRVMVLDTISIDGVDWFEQVGLGREDVNKADVLNALRTVGLEWLAEPEHHGGGHAALEDDDIALVRLAVARAMVARPSVVIVPYLFDDLPAGLSRQFVAVLTQNTDCTTIVLTARDAADGAGTSFEATPMRKPPHSPQAFT